MKEKDQKEYLEKYKKAKEAGVPFYPDILFKDAVASLIIFVVLIALASFLGAPLEERANPSDSTYTPKPEWYFLFLFQLLKKFPGKLEVVGVIIIPTIAILLLFLLPLIDRGPRRHFFGRPWITGITTLTLVGIGYLTIQSIRETPPPAEQGEGDPIAALYTKNCATCHGESIAIPAGTNLHDVIAQGNHEGMPAWSGDLTSDEIDALAGFILSPGGNKLFLDYCGACHIVSDLVASDPIELKASLDQGTDYPPHKDVTVPNWDDVLTQQNRTALLNFLVAPDGQRLFVTNCSPCHGRAVAFSGDEATLRNLISQGGLHLEMPPWQEKLSDAELDTLAQYVSSTTENQEGEDLFSQHCSSCHGQRVPTMNDFALAREKIAGGGSHEEMPVWGEILTDEQLNALVSYTLEAAQGTPLEVGQELFSQNCSPCHGDFGEGGPNPTRPDDVIAPISSAEYLKTRDDFTLYSIIAQGQPTFGMSPFGSANGGPLSDDQVNAIVAYLRSWEANPPVELPPEVKLPEDVALTSKEIYSTICSQCHTLDGRGIGPSLNSPQFQASNTDQSIFDSISLGHPASPMIAWGEILTDEQIQQLVEIIRNLPLPETEIQSKTPGTYSFSKDVLPILDVNCKNCHGTMGGWDGSTYESVMTSGINAPVIVPGDVENSLLAQKLLDIQATGSKMPPSEELTDEEIQTIIDWIATGALDN